jgi:hypothetical protein
MVSAYGRCSRKGQKRSVAPESSLTRLFAPLDCRLDRLRRGRAAGRVARGAGPAGRCRSDPAPAAGTSLTLRHRPEEITMEFHFEGAAINSMVQDRIKQAFKVVVDAANSAANTARTPMGTERIKRWFHSGNLDAARRGIALINRIVIDDSRSYTFVEMSAKQYWCAPAAAGQIPPPPPQVGMTFVKPTVGAAVFTSDTGEDQADIIEAVNNFGKEMKSHAGSGMRIYLYKHFFETLLGKCRDEFKNDIRYHAHCLAHELSHKILNTVDIVYGPTKCQQLVLDEPWNAVFNADNWGCFFTNYTWPEQVA